MAKRINITITDNLFEKLQTVKENLNVSGVCQEAIASAVKIEELKQKGTVDMGTVIERLREEKRAFVQVYHVQGKEEALEDAKEIPYGDFVAISEGEDPRSLGRFDGRWFEDRLRSDPDFDINAFFEGWVEGIKEFWEDIKGKI